MTKIQVDYYAAAEQARHNQATERETNRSNLVGESLKAESNAISSRQADAAQQQARNSANNAEYTRQHYERQDTETNRSNLANETINRNRNWETALLNAVSSLVEGNNPTTKVYKTQSSRPKPNEDQKQRFERGLKNYQNRREVTGHKVPVRTE
nr:putative ORF1 [Marmot picobirnavirus]